MLYKEHWQELSYSGISLRSLIAWLETMPADEPYNYRHIILAVPKIAVLP